MTCMRLAKIDRSSGTLYSCHHWFLLLPYYPYLTVEGLLLNASLCTASDHSELYARETEAQPVINGERALVACQDFQIYWVGRNRDSDNSGEIHITVPTILKGVFDSQTTDSPSHAVTCSGSSVTSRLSLYPPATRIHPAFTLLYSIQYAHRNAIDINSTPPHASHIQHGAATVA